MTHEHTIKRYRQWYVKLLRFYPKPYREHFGGGMEQTFNDLCHERHKTGDGLFGFMLWTFTDTVVGIIKEHLEKENTAMESTLKRHGALIILIITAIAIPATAYLLKGTEHENSWLYILAVGLVFASAFELYFKHKIKS